MSRPKSARLRMSLFASSSLVGSSLLAGFGGLVVTMAPGAAFAVPVTCAPIAEAPPPALQAAAGTQVCSGTDDNGIGYSATGALTVTFGAAGVGETVTKDGVHINDAAAGGAAAVTVTTAVTSSLGNSAGTGDAGAGLSIILSKGGAIVANTGDSIITSALGEGVYISQASGSSNISYTSTGTISTSAPATHYGVFVSNASTGNTIINLGNGVAGSTAVSDGGVRVISGSSGNLTLTTSGDIKNTGAGRAAIDMFANDVPSKQSMALIATGNISSTNGSAVRAVTSSNAPISLTFSGAGTAITGAATALNPVISTNTVLGAATVNIGSSTAPTNSGYAPAAAVTVGKTNTDIVFGASGGGSLAINVGRSIGGHDATGAGTSVSQLGGTAVLNGHVDFSGLTGNSSITLVGEVLPTDVVKAPLGTYQSVWNLGGTKALANNVSTFGSGNDTIENRGIINIGSVGAPAQVVMNFGGPGAVIAVPAVAGPPAVPAVVAALPAPTGTANGDRFYNRGAQSPSSTQNLYTPGTINIVGVDASLTVTGLEVFTNEGAAYLNIRNTTNLTDFVGANKSATKASAQSFAMNPGGSYATVGGKPAGADYSQFSLLFGTMPSLQGSNGIPGSATPSGGVNLADGDTLDTFAISGVLVGNGSFNTQPIAGARFLVDFDLKTHSADQLWFGALSGNVTVVPRFNYAISGAAATYDPYGILFASNVSNPTADQSFQVDFQSQFNPRDTTYPSLANSQADQGLYRGYVVYRQGQGATSVTAGGTAFTATKTGGYFLTEQPDTEFWQFANMGSAVQDAIRDSTGNYFTRQADLRDAVGDNIAGGWLKISGNRSKFEKNISYPFTPQGVGATLTLLDVYTQTTVDVTAGADGEASLGKGKLVVGGAVGYTDSDVRFLGNSWGGVSAGQVTQPYYYIPSYSENRTSMEGYHAAGYASYIQDQFFVDGALSYTSLDLHSIFSTLNNAIFSTNTKTINAKVLSGMRFVADDVFSIEPLVGLDMMRTTQDSLTTGLNIGASNLTFPNLISVRPGVGARVKVASATDLYKLNLGLSGMWWHDLKKDGSQVKTTSGGNSFVISDTRGTRDTAEVETNVNMIFANGLSAFINGSASGDMGAYLDIGFSAGARYRW